MSAAMMLDGTAVHICENWDEEHVFPLIVSGIGHPVRSADDDYFMNDRVYVAEDIADANRIASYLQRRYTMATVVNHLEAA